MFGLGCAGKRLFRVVAQILGCWQPIARSPGQDDVVLCRLAPMLTPALPGGRRNLVLPSLEALNNCLCLSSPVLLWGLVEEHKTLLQGQWLGLSPRPHGC